MTTEPTTAQVDIGPERVNEVCNGLAGMCISHPHFASPGHAIELLHQLRIALTAGDAVLRRCVERLSYLSNLQDELPDITTAILRDARAILAKGETK